MFTLKRKGDYRLQLTRTLKQPGRYKVELYLFTPHESRFSTWTLSEQQFFFGSLEHRLNLLGLPDKDRIGKVDSSFTLLSPHYEIMQGSRLFQYRASMERLRQQLQGTDFSAEPLRRALRLSQKFAQRLRHAIPAQSKQQGYYRLVDIYFSWHAEQFMLECMTMEGYAGLEQSLKNSILEFLEREHRHRRKRKYLSDFSGTPTRVWNRMRLYHRLLEYPVVLRSEVTEVGGGTRRAVKAISTMLIMSLFTYVLFNVREGSQKLSLTLLLGIALIYALRDLLRDDMITGITHWLRKGQPRWKIRLRMPYTNKVLALQKVWLDYRKAPELPQAVLDHSGKWANNEERQIICYRSVLVMDESALEQDQIQERLTLDCEGLCEMIEITKNRIFVAGEENDPSSPVQVHSIEKQQFYNLLLVHTGPDQDPASAQRWHLQLGRNGIVQCDSKEVNWPKPESKKKWGWKV